MERRRSRDQPCRAATDRVKAVRSIAGVGIFARPIEQRERRRAAVRNSRAGALVLEHDDGQVFSLAPGMSWHVGDDEGPPHRVTCEAGARVFIVDYGRRDQLRGSPTATTLRAVLRWMSLP